MNYAAEVADRMILDVLRAHPELNLDDLMLECREGGGMSVIRRTPEMKWLDWHSDNHGWESQ